MAEDSNAYRDKPRSINPHLSRRSFIGAGAGAVAVALLSACGGSGSSPTPASSNNAGSSGSPAASNSGQAQSTSAPVRGVTIPTYDNPPAGKPQGSQPSELVISFGIDQLTTHGIDPQLHVATTDEAKLRHIYEPLVKFERDLQTITPQLATAWKQVDPLTMEFTLRQGSSFRTASRSMLTRPSTASCAR